ncbi:MAG: hypothetical protein Q7S08_03360 [bacterium]|nr:hypothetical protein [bacterium]
MAGIIWRTMHSFKILSVRMSLGAIFFLLLGATTAFAASPSDIHITPDGKFSATNVVVYQKAGTSNFFSRVTWGSAYVRVTVLAHDDTAVTKAHGEPATVNDIREGDVLDVEGKLSSGEGALTIYATRIRDTSLQVESKTLSGIAVSTSPGNSSLVLSNTIFGATTTVMLSASTTIQKGVRTISLSDISPGDKILSVSGTYNYAKNIFLASLIEVYQDKSIFVPRNFQGTLKNVSATVLPATLTVTVGTTDYTVYLASSSSVLRNNKKPSTLSRFVVGDTVRFYGGIRQTNFSEIDAEIVRDLSF